MEIKDEELCDLSVTIARFALPRLKKFKETTRSHPVGMSEEKWDELLDHMIYAMEYYHCDIRPHEEVDFNRVDLFINQKRKISSSKF